MRILKQHCKGQRARELYEARYEKRLAEKREFTARKKAGLLTPEEIDADSLRREKSSVAQKAWREKRKAAEPPKPPKKPSQKCGYSEEKREADINASRT